MDNRGVSRVLSYSLVLTISTVLVAGLLIAGSTFVGDQRGHVVDSELEVIGERLAADISTADRLVRMGDGPRTVRLTARVPASVGGSNYDVNVLASGGDASLRIEATSLDRSVTVPLSNTTDVAPGTVMGEDIVVEYDATDDHLELSND